MAMQGVCGSQFRYRSFDTLASNGAASTLPHGLVARYSLAPLSISALAGVSTLQGQKNHSNSREALSAVVLAFTLGFVAATTSPTSEHVSSGSGAKFSRRGGGSGGPKNVGSIYSGRQRAEEDIRELEEEALHNPYTVSFCAFRRKQRIW